MLLLALFSLFAFVGCTDDVEDTDEVAYIDFGRESASSRGIESWNESLYPPESLYWTYTAKKIRGNYTTGQTLTEETVLKNGPATGLGKVGPFSVGVWEFKLYGYLSCTETTTGELEFSDLVYTGKTGTADNAYTTTIDKRPASTSGVQEIIFELSVDEDPDAVEFWNGQKGVLELSDMYLTVPEGQRFTTDSSVTTVVRVTVSDVTVPASPVKVAVSTTNLTVTDGIKESGTRFDLNNFEFESAYSPVAKFDAGVRNLQFKAEYKDVFTSVAVDDDATTPQPQYTDGWAEIGTISTYPVPFTKGVKTTLSGDINDIKVDTDESAHKDNFTAAVVKILKTGKTGTEADAYDMFGSIAKAAAVYGDEYHKNGSNANPIEVMRNIDNGGSVVLTGDIVVKLNNFLISNLTVSGSGKVITFKLADTNRDYKFGEGKLVNLTCTTDTAYIQTDDGKLDVTAPNDSVYHTGTADSVAVTSVSKDAGKGYFLGTTKEGTSPVTSVSTFTLTAGNVELGSYTAVNALTVTPTSTSVATIKGRTTTEVGNINTIRDTAYTGNIFKKVILNANGGTGTSPVTKYGIEGMYMDLNFAVPFTAPTTELMFNCWNTKTDRSGTDVSGRVCVGSSETNLYAVWGSPVAKIETTTAGVFAYFGTLHEAVSKYGTTEYGTNPVILLSNISDESFTPAVANAKVNTNGKTITNVTLSGTTAVDFMSTGGGSYKFSAGKINSLEIYAGGCAFNTEGTVDVNASGETAVQSGTAASITVTAGSLFMEGTTATLDVKAGASVKCTEGATPVTTTGTRKYNGTALTAWYKSETSGADSVYKKITINGNGTSSTDKVLYFYAVEGERVTLPTGKFTAPTGTSFSGWNTEVLLTGESYADGEAFNTFDTKTLYAVWGRYVAKILNSDGITYTYFTTLESAVAAWTAGGNRIILCADVPSAVLSKVGVEVELDGYSLENVSATSTSAGLFKVFPGTGSAPLYSFGLSDTKKIVKIAADKGQVRLDVSGANVGVTDCVNDVWITGTVGFIDVVEARNDRGLNKGVHVNAQITSSDVGLAVRSGFVDIGENLTVPNLKIDAGDLDKVILIGRPSATVSKFNGDANWKTSTTIAGATDQTAFKTVTLNSNGAYFAPVSGRKVTVKWFGIEGMMMDLGTTDTVFSANLSDNFRCWFDEDGKNYSAGSSYLISGDSVLSAKWVRLVGGRIYYDAGSNGVTYVFYKADGTEITTWSNVDALKDAFCYAGENASGKDRFYVFDNTNFQTSNLLWGFGNGSTTYGLYGTTPANGAVGMGKVITRFMLDKAPKTVGVLGLPEGQLSSTAVTVSNNNYRCMFDAFTVSVNSGGGTPAAGGKYTFTRETIWSYIDYLNNGNTNGRYNLCNFSSSGSDPKVCTPGGCNDWYIGSMVELCELAVWSGLWEAKSGYTYGGYGKKSTSTAPSDTDKFAIYDLLNAHGHLWTCNEGSSRSGDGGSNDGTMGTALNGSGHPLSSKKCFQALSCIGIRSF